MTKMGIIKPVSELTEYVTPPKLIMKKLNLYAFILISTT